MEVGSNLLQEIRKGQVEDKKIQEIKRNIKEEKTPIFQKMRNVCCGIREEFVCLTSSN
jgi:hypothetical protein